jgi:fused signal recognition particle receptor
MVFWRKKNNQSDQEREEREDKIVHPPGAPAIEPSTDFDLAPQPDHLETETEVIEHLRDVPVPAHIPAEDAKEAEDLSDHSDEGGWLSRLAHGLSKSTSRFTQGLSDLLTKSKLDGSHAVSHRFLAKIILKLMLLWLMRLLFELS